jgi:exodeoxyribonuclease V gamma subunit
LEVLAEQLAQIVRDPLASAISPEIIVVQSRGMQRWVSMELARHNGICANVTFPFPNAFLHDLFRKLIPELPDETVFDPAALTLKIMKLLPDCAQRKGFEHLQGYLKNDAHNLKRFQISEKIANLFDQYLVFRPEMILQWEKGRKNHWQAQLWRLLASDSKVPHRARLRNTLLAKIIREPGGLEAFPERVSLFGISYLPPFYLETFVELSRLTQVNLFLMNPCKEYWADIVGDREIRTMRRKHGHIAEIQAEFYLERGNRLLASMGALGRDFLQTISGLEGRVQEHYIDPVPKDVLSGIQSDILSLRDRQIQEDSDPVYSNESDGLVTRLSIHSSQSPDDDRSIQVHSCHSPMREIEVLHDNLLAMFEQDQDLRPRDIIVMTPDIELYGPYIQAVFDAQIEEALRIPFSIADMGVRKESLTIEGFLSILELAHSRFSVPQVRKLLEVPGIKEKFHLSESDIRVVERWIKSSNIRWGIDAEQRRHLGLPPFAENTWKAGIERLLLGYALPGCDRRMFSGILPYDDIEGSEARIFGKFLEFFNRLLNVVAALQRDRTLADWQTIFDEILEQLFAPKEETEREIQMLRRRFNDLSINQGLSGFDEPIGIHVVKSYLGNLLMREHLETGFVTSGVTFCTMLPMRSIPFKVVCLVGMDSDAFPRESKSIGFDLMIKHPRKGDRSRRNDDKYMFLEALISARKRLYISYVGQSIQDNSQRPPSVLVSELLDYIDAGFGLASEQVITQHKLQAFSPDYFTEGRKLFSYSRENFAAVGSRSDHQAPRPLISAALSTPAPEWKTLEVDTLGNFFRNPTKFLLEKRLGIHMAEGEAAAEEREHFNLDGLERYGLGNDLVQSGLSGLEVKDHLHVHQARGRLPHGNVGELVYSEISADARRFVGKIMHHTEGKTQDSLKVDLDIAGFTLRGWITANQTDGLLHIHYAKLKPKYLLNSWVYHLLFNVINERDLPCRSLLVCKDSIWEFEPVPSPVENLAYLLELYWKGMSEPLKFFPESSYEYARRIMNHKQTKTAALNAARRKWLASDFFRGESEDPYYDTCFKHIDPIDEEFQSIAENVFTPLLNHCTPID